MLKPDVDFGELYEALTDRLSRIESMAAARVGENEGENSYPRQISLGERAVGWIEDQIEEWLKRQIEQGRKVRQDRHPNGRLKAGRSEQPREGG
jgi:hypothetical protein